LVYEFFIEDYTPERGIIMLYHHNPQHKDADPPIPSANHPLHFKALTQVCQRTRRGFLPLVAAKTRTVKRRSEDAEKYMDTFLSADATSVLVPARWRFTVKLYLTYRYCPWDILPIIKRSADIRR
jgi:hypothetical protein